MQPTFFLVALTVITIAVPSRSEAQQHEKIPRIGFLEGATVAESQGIDPFRQGLREFGYIDGQNIVVEIRSMGGKIERIPDIIGEFVSGKVDIIFTPVTSAAQVSKKAAAIIPIVVVVADPVASGLVQSLARPGGNVTGLSGFAELGGKRLEILKDTIPNLSRAVFRTPGIRPMEFQFQEMEAVTGILRIKLQTLEVRGPEDFESAFNSAKQERAGALTPIRSPMLVNHRNQFLKLAESHRLPAMYDDRNFVEPWGADVLWARPGRFVSARCLLC